MIKDLHKLGIVHSDIHRGNILSNENHRFVIIDFQWSFFNAGYGAERESIWKNNDVYDLFNRVFTQSPNPYDIISGKVFPYDELRDLFPYGSSTLPQYEYVYSLISIPMIYYETALGTAVKSAIEIDLSETTDINHSVEKTTCRIAREI